MLAMLQIMRLIKDIEELINEGKIVRAEKKIPEVALRFVDQIERSELSERQIDQTSDRFFVLFDIQLRKRIFPSEIGELLERCFSLHAFVNGKKAFQGSKEFWEEVARIKYLAQ